MVCVGFFQTHFNVVRVHISDVSKLSTCVDLGEHVRLQDPREVAGRRLAATEMKFKQSSLG